MSGAPAETGHAPLFWTPRVLLLAGAGALLGVAAVVLRTSVPLFLALPLLLAPIAAGLFLPRRTIVARVEWTERGTGGRIRIAGRIRTDPPVAPTLLYPTFHAPGPLTERMPPELEVVDPNLAFTVEYETPFPCILDIPLPEIVWRDPLGLAESPVTVVGEPLAVERYPPELHRLGVVNLRRTTPLPGEIRSKALGSAGDFFTVRGAVPTDTPRQINWPSTARVGRLMANDYLLERTGDLVLLLDLRPTELGRGRDEQLLSVSRAGAFGIASAFLQTKSRVGIGAFGEFLEAIPLGTGRRQRFRIRRLLRSATISAETGPAERLAVSMRQYFPPGVLTILISPLAGEDQMLLLPHLRRRGYPVVVLSPSPVPVLLPPSPLDGPEDVLARRMLRLERRQRLGEAWGEAPAVDWENYWSLAPLVALLHRPNPRGGFR
ncbi:MAG TPA: DUF58 domain-containing protein [Thermoplasmata archaeon]|nr:DUF58 domain-containing protein [Thermoplasmata archaeon]